MEHKDTVKANGQHTLIKDYRTNTGKVLKVGTVLIVDREMERELMVLGCIEGMRPIETAVLIDNKKEIRKQNKLRRVK